MSKNKANMEDEKLKELLSGTKITAGENFKYRVMQQIETEKSLSQKKESPLRPLLGNMISIFGVMYALIAGVGIFIYFTGGKSALESAAFFLPVILIASVCSLFWMISAYDDRRRSNQKNRH